MLWNNKSLKSNLIIFWTALHWLSHFSAQPNFFFKNLISHWLSTERKCWRVLNGMMAWVPGSRMSWFRPHSRGNWIRGEPWWGRGSARGVLLRRSDKKILQNISNRVSGTLLNSSLRIPVWCGANIRSSFLYIRAMLNWSKIIRGDEYLRIVFQ